MPIPEWHEAIAQLEHHVFRIMTPDGSGTGFLVSSSTTTPLCAVATAAHVIDHAHYWDEPIRLHHPSSDKSLLLKPDGRAIRVNPGSDTASIVFERGELTLPETVLPLLDRDKHLRPGVEIGWLGYPAIPRAGLCFFSGRISTYLEGDAMYLVDGVAINGVSGGPAFRCGVDSAQLMGVVSAYIPNRATGDVLPGVAVVRDVSEFHDLADRFRTLDEAQAQQTPPEEAPPPPEGDASNLTRI